MSAPRCSATTATGAPCKAKPSRGKDVCLWHDESPEARERHRSISARGGNTKAYGALAEGDPLANDKRVAALNLSTASGLRDFLAASLAGLARLPYTERTANSIASLANAARGVIETSDLEARLLALEQREQPGASPPPVSLVR